MTWKKYLKYLSIVTMALAMWGIGVSGIGKNQNTIWIYALSIICFIIISILIFLYAYNTSATDHLFSFNNVVSASFLFKLILSIGMLLLYEKIFEPSSNIHVLHFIFVYIVYTIYEVYFLTKLAKSSE